MAFFPALLSERVRQVKKGGRCPDTFRFPAKRNGLAISIVFRAMRVPARTHVTQKTVYPGGRHVRTGSSGRLVPVMIFFYHDIFFMKIIVFPFFLQAISCILPTRFLLVSGRFFSAGSIKRFPWYRGIRRHSWPPRYENAIALAFRAWLPGPRRLRFHVQRN